MISTCQYRSLRQYGQNETVRDALFLTGGEGEPWMLSPRNGRVARDLKTINELNDVNEFKLLDPVEDLSATHKVEFIGPTGSPYAGHTLTLQISFPTWYPFEPPCVTFLPPIPYHPNIDGEGRICLDMIKMPPSGAWRPTVSLLSLLYAVRMLLLEPNPDDPLLPDIANEYLHDRATFMEKASKVGSNQKAPSNTMEMSKDTLTSGSGSGLRLLSLRKRKVEE